MTVTILDTTDWQRQKPSLRNRLPLWVFAQKFPIDPISNITNYCQFSLLYSSIWSQSLLLKTPLIWTAEHGKIKLEISSLLTYFPSDWRCYAHYRRRNTAISSVQVWTLRAAMTTSLARLAKRCDRCRDAMRVIKYTMIGLEAFSTSRNSFLATFLSQKPVDTQHRP